MIQLLLFDDQPIQKKISQNQQDLIDWLDSFCCTRTLQVFLTNHDYTDDEIAMLKDRLRPKLKLKNRSSAMREWHKKEGHDTTEPVSVQECRKCGCTNATPCAAGCYWVFANLCSRCHASDNNQTGDLLEIP